jgi:hypothetical protein
VRYRVTYVRRPLRYRYLTIHPIVCVQYLKSEIKGRNLHSNISPDSTHGRRPDQDPHLRSHGHATCPRSFLCHRRSRPPALGRRQQRTMTAAPLVTPALAKGRPPATSTAKIQTGATSLTTRKAPARWAPASRTPTRCSALPADILHPHRHRTDANASGRRHHSRL